MAARRVLRHAGFTLVELLVALFVMSLLAILSWRGLDGMVRVQEQTQGRADEVIALQVGLAQWGADLDAMVQLPGQSAIDWNGRVLRITRRNTASSLEGVHVVAWARRAVGGTSRWARWQSPPLTSRGALDDAWGRADAWAQSAAAADGNEVAVTALQDWQIFYYRGDAWTNPLSSDAVRAGAAPTPVPPAPASPPAAGAPPAGPTPLTAAQAAPRTAVIPDGVRLVLTLPAGQAIAGTLVRDWVRPTLGGGK